MKPTDDMTEDEKFYEESLKLRSARPAKRLGSRQYQHAEWAEVPWGKDYGFSRPRWTPAQQD